MRAQEKELEQAQAKLKDREKQLVDLNEERKKAVEENAALKERERELEETSDVLYKVYL
jgi:predicted nuclease with TOPRIM domain